MKRRSKSPSPHRGPHLSPPSCALIGRSIYGMAPIWLRVHKATVGVDSEIAGPDHSCSEDAPRMNESTHTYMNEKMWFTGRRAHMGQKPNTTMSPTTQIFQNAIQSVSIPSLLLVSKLFFQYLATAVEATDRGERRNASKLLTASFGNQAFTS